MSIAPKRLHLKLNNGDPFDAQVADADTGEELKAVAELTIHIKPGEAVTLDGRLLSIDVTGRAGWQVRDPRDGKIRRVARIEFADGDVIWFDKET